MRCIRIGFLVLYKHNTAGDIVNDVGQTISFGSRTKSTVRINHSHLHFISKRLKSDVIYGDIMVGSGNHG